MNSLKNYSLLLNEDPWKQKCNEMLYSNYFTCHNCGMVGFHNNSILTFKDIEKCFSFIDKWNWTIGGKSLSQWIMSVVAGTFVPDSYFIKDSFCDIDVSVINKMEGLTQYEVETPIDYIWDFPSLFLISPSLIKQVSFHLIYYTDCISDSKLGCNCKSDGRISIVKFNKALSKDVYLTVEKKRGHMTLFDTICISFHNMLICFESPYKYGLKGLNIHHKIYIKGREPWDYDQDSFELLCNDCHRDVHEKSKIPVFDQSDHEIRCL